VDAATHAASRTAAAPAKVPVTGSATKTFPRRGLVPNKTGATKLLFAMAICRRASTYGAGMRYAVVYKANRNQIRDPNRIYPGQIFVLPMKAR
jgi:hypothetical protein